MVIEKRGHIQSPTKPHDEGYSDNPEDSSDSEFERMCERTQSRKCISTESILKKQLASNPFVIVL